MKAMIMAAGVGSRLMPLTVNLPKPMVPVANRPVMEHTVKLLRKHGFTDIIANLHYLPHVIRDYFGDGQRFGVNFNYSFEEELLGTAGGVKNNEWFLDDTFVIVSGDALTDIDLTSLVRFHKQKKALATIALKPVDDVTHYGIVVTDEDGRIVRFQEKPKAEEALSNMANTGIYVFDPEIFKLIPSKQYYDFGKNLFPYLVKVGAPFYGCPIDRYWCDIGTLDVYRQAHYDILKGKVYIDLSDWMLSSRIRHGANVTIHPTAKILGHAMIGSNTNIGTDVEIYGEVVIGDNCVIEDGAVIRGSIIWDGVRISKGTVLNNCIVASNCEIGPNSVVDYGATIGEGCILELFSRVGRDVRVWPQLRSNGMVVADRMV